MCVLFFSHKLVTQSWLLFSLIMGGPLVTGHIKKPECERMNREANVIMSDWMCKCVHGGGLYSGSDIWHLESFELHVATLNVMCFIVSLSFWLPFFFLSFLVCSITVREKEREQKRKRERIRR